jgi:uncharacterized membrane protein
MTDLTLISDQSGRGWNLSRLFGVLLMMPIGIILVFVLLYFGVSRGGFFPGELLVFFLVIFIVLFVARLLFWRSRRGRMRRYWRQDESFRILRERYARGEITKEQFDQMLRDLERRP